MAVVFAAIGIYQYETRDLFWNPKLLVSNAYAPFYRVNSVFWDPSIYGRFLVVAILALLVVVLFGARPAGAARRDGRDRGDLGRALLLVLAVELRGARRSGSCSRAIFAWGRRGLALAIVAARGRRGRPRWPRRASATTSSATTRRARRAAAARSCGAARTSPSTTRVAGVGLGGFKHAYAELAGLKGKEPNAAASHTTPVTVAAEGGIVGFALYVWLLVAALAARVPPLRARPRRARRAHLRPRDRARSRVHSLFYNAFFEDPTVWAAIGLAAALPRRRDERRGAAAARPAGRTRAAAGPAGRRR